MSGFTLDRELLEASTDTTAALVANSAIATSVSLRGVLPNRRGFIIMFQP
ncbi:MAG: hypothetical protein J2P57_01455 [Acidimicrobiaceae bacterium]|nr:hypothetical protein [Acidimicrobiaceae bacterium]